MSVNAEMQSLCVILVEVVKLGFFGGVNFTYLYDFILVD